MSLSFLFLLCIVSVCVLRVILGIYIHSDDCVCVEQDRFINVCDGLLGNFAGNACVLIHFTFLILGVQRRWELDSTSEVHLHSNVVPDSFSFLV